MLGGSKSVSYLFDSSEREFDFERGEIKNWEAVVDEY